jgi:arylsulfatase A-like enzyme
MRPAARGCERHEAALIVSGSFTSRAPPAAIVSSRMRARFLALALALLWAAPVAHAAPNVVVIETDDQVVGDLAAMPQTRALIADAGVTFDNSFVSLSLCCPSRATFLTGQYAHNHGVRSISPPWGGFSKLHGSETLAVWLQRAGYSTGLVGKYLNGYGGNVVPPGWTDFQGLLSSSTYRFFDYTMNVNGVREHFGDDVADYQTDVLTQRSLDFIREHTGDGAPFFLWTTFVAPHVGQPHDLQDPIGVKSTVPAPRDWNAFAGALLPRPPSFDEADVSDKPPSVRYRPRLSRWRIAAIANTYRQRLASLLAVDEGVGRIVDALRAAGQLDNTLLIFTSDNGFMVGEHRIPGGKVVPYEPSIRVPLLMRGPGIPAGVHRAQLAFNGDLAPTILDAAHARAGLALDGRSLLPFARSARVHSGRAILIEAPPGNRTNGLPMFTGLRTPRYKYVQYLHGARELYDLRRDPWELDNLAGKRSAAGVQRRLARRLARLRGCAGADCR